MKTHVLAIDIGNTKTKIGVIDTVNFSCLHKTIVSSLNNTAIVVTITTYREDYPETKNNPIKISSTIKSKVKQLLFLVKNKSEIADHRIVGFHQNLPITITYKNPHQLGADRISNCLFGFNKYPKENCILISSGTATTIDFLSSLGKYWGGFIMPGIQTQLNGLNANTAELPLVSQNIMACSFPPQSTESAIIEGIRHQLAGGISLIVRKLTDHFGPNAKVLVCGGEWKSIESYVTFPFTFNPDITLIGTALYED